MTLHSLPYSPLPIASTRGSNSRMWPAPLVTESPRLDSTFVYSSTIFDSSVIPYTFRAGRRPAKSLREVVGNAGGDYRNPRSFISCRKQHSNCTCN